MRGASRSRLLAALAPVPALRSAWLSRSPSDWPEALRPLRADWAQARQPTARSSGTRPSLVTDARCSAIVAAVDAAARQTLDLAPHDGQWLAALALLDGRLAEMATGEGKTLALALAAAVAALAGEPVHAITANDYLVERDAQRMAPLFARLGLRVAAVLPGQDDATRRAAWRADIVYTTARELVFDHLRDGLDAGTANAADAALRDSAHRLAGDTRATPRLARGLVTALIDEADSVLLDEATMPLILSQAVADPARQALLWRAMRLARTLTAGDDFRGAEGGGATAPLVLTEAGRARLDDATREAPAAWTSRRERDEWVTQALRALHGLRRDHDYVVGDGEVQIIDTVTGRRAEGRQWSHGLHALVALKEGMRPPAETRTLAQTRYPEFFARYRHLGGMSGTLREARAEFAQAYGLAVLRVPLARPSRRVQHAARVFADDAARRAAVVRRCAELAQAGRAVLVGTDSVEASEALAQALRTAGLEPAVLNARQDADEAALVARAGEPGRITVATRMAGRGTDIAPAPEVLARGGLHVLSCQRNPSARLDRQLAGRAARQGQPGSAEHWHVWPAGAAEDVHWWRFPPLSTLLGLVRGADNRWRVPALLVQWLADAAARRAQARERAQRLALAAQSREHDRRLRFAHPRS